MSSRALICLYVCFSAVHLGALASPESDKSLNVGKIFAKQGKYQLAITELKAAIEIDPSNADCWSILGACYMHIGKWDEAKAAYQKATSLSTGVNSIPANTPANTGDDWKKRPETYERAKKSYMYDMGKLIKKNWHPNSKLFTNSVEVQFKVRRDGKPSSPFITKSSGDTSIDNAALKAVLDTPTLGTLPPELGEEIDAIMVFDNFSYL